MADVFIDSTAVGSDTGADWANAYNAGNHTDWTRAATDASAAGDRIIVASDNLSTVTSNLSFTANANHTEDNPLQVIVSSSAGGGTDVDPVATYGASGNGEIDANNLDFDPSGHIFFHGLRVVSPDSSSLDGGGDLVTWQNCYYLMDKSTTETFTISSESQVRFIDSDIEITTSDHNISFADNGSFYMQGGSITTDANVNEIFIMSSAAGANIDLNSVDMTGMNSGTDLFNDTSIGFLRIKAPFCKWNSTIPPLFGGTATELSTLDSLIVTGDQITTSVQYRHGSVLDETTIRRASGATDGTTTYSLKIESNSNAARNAPFRHKLATLNPGDLDTNTIKVHFAQNSGGALDDGDIWIECYVLTSSGVKTITDRLPIGEASTTNHTDESGNVDWRNGAGALTGYNEQSCSVTVSGATTGILQVFLCCALDFTTTNNLYVDPAPVIS